MTKRVARRVPDGSSGARRLASYLVAAMVTSGPPPSYERFRRLPGVRRRESAGKPRPPCTQRSPGAKTAKYPRAVSLGRMVQHGG